MGRYIANSAVLMILLATVPHAARAAAQLPVFVSIAPQRYFVQQIGKELVDVRIMVEPGASPATYEPKPRQMVHLAKARIYFAIGVPFETVWLNKIASSNPNMTIVQTDEGIKKIALADHRHYRRGADHQETDQYHKQEHGQDSGILDPHISSNTQG